MGLSVIHLTDIHLNSDYDKNPVLKRKDFICDACSSVISKNDKVVIIISGDIAFSGQTKEYEYAEGFICYIRNKLSTNLDTNVDILITPGNHDCDFTIKRDMRERLMSTINSTSQIDAETLSAINNVQENFFEFTKKFAEYDGSKLCNGYPVKFNDKNILFQLYNSAWMSVKDEIPGKIIMPSNHLCDIKEDEYDCVFSVMHHPYNWLHPDNSADFMNHLRKTTDILMLGHEHRRDEYKVNGQEWSFLELRGKELQGDKQDDSAFAIYQLDDALQNITTYDFTWDGTLYKRSNEKQNAFLRNTLISSTMLVPSKEYLKENDDPGMIINHFNVSDVHLSELFCWNDLKICNIETDNAIKAEKKIKSNIPKRLLENNISIVIGGSLTGKTSLSKMLYKEYSLFKQCCVSCNGKYLNTIVEKNLRKIIEEKFVAQYNAKALDKYILLSPEQRILIIDDYNDIQYCDERRSKVLSYLAAFASHIIILADGEMEMRMICSQVDMSDKIKIGYYEVLNFGNIKRRELVTKWYCLRDEYARGDELVEAKIDNACQKIDGLLGSSKGFVPATPIYIIDILQNIDSVAPASFSGSQYGFLYESLINKSLSTLKYKNQGDVNIDINIMCAVAFDVLKENGSAFTEEKLCKIAMEFCQKKKVWINEPELLKKMISSKLINKVGIDTYKFSYPYIFYYFAGRYIAYNIKDADVEEQMEYMISRLYNEKYGNIVIFVCHFANNTSIIEDILLVSYTSLEKYKEFDFTKHIDIFARANDIINKLLIPENVGSEYDVEKNREIDLESKDKAGIKDGTVYEPDEVSDEEARAEKDMASLAAAAKTMDVLGQIIRNYPGDIDGDMKIQIIDEIHKLGMRIMEALFTTIGVLEEGFISNIIENIKSENTALEPMKNEKKTDEVNKFVERVRVTFSVIIANMAYGMIKLIASALCNESLLLAVEETFADSKSISERLIIEDLRFNLLKKPDINEALKLADEFQKKADTFFAYTILRSIISQYLTLNRCGQDVRAKLCTRFKFSDKSAIIVRAIEGKQD